MENIQKHENKNKDRYKVEKGQNNSFRRKYNLKRKTEESFPQRFLATEKLNVILIREDFKYEMIESVNELKGEIVEINKEDQKDTISELIKQKP